MKSLVYETPVNSAEELVARISAAAGKIRNTPEMLSNVRRSMKRRCEACITCGGRQFSLSRDTIVHALPRIDTSKTSIKDICPTFLKPVKCELSRYRTLTGMCNNLEHPSWGSARSSMVRYLPPEYADAIQEPRKSVDGSELPSARIVSFMMHHDVSEHHSHINILLVFWGQMVDHDMTLAAQTVDHEKQDIECCKFPPEHQHPNCMNIKVPADDPFYKYFKRQCLDFARIYAGPKPGCKLGNSLSI
ncbi:chorion peroxidase [Trichonephila clavipes]|nr:chorion peroxidase [Trichonephila clavipes]